MEPVSIVIPCYNEEASLRRVVAGVRDHLSAAGIPHEVIVVVDGATDGTALEAAEVADQVVEHPQNMGYGRSLKSGILVARHDLIAIIDADETYPVNHLAELVRLAERFDMVVGARSGVYYESSLFKRIGRYIFRKLSEFSVGQTIPDINSGLRVFRRSQILPFFPIISAGYSFTTTSTLAYMHNDLCVYYLPVEYHARTGRSKVRHLRDSLRALQIIVEAILRCNPIKVFLLLAAPYVLLSFVCVIVALATMSAGWGAASLVSLYTAGVILGMGFLAVALMPPRRTVERPCTPQVGSNGGKPAHD